jgi:hypothetical protein
VSGAARGAEGRGRGRAQLGGRRRAQIVEQRVGVGVGRSSAAARADRGAEGRGQGRAHLDGGGDGDASRRQRLPS